MSTLHITRGLPASGKTTWAKQWVAADPSNRARINRDDFRAMMFDKPDYSWPQESAVTEASRTAVRALLATGRDVIADDMNLRPKYVREWVRFARANGAEVEVTEFPISVEEAIERDAARDRVVGAEVITRMAQKYLQKGHLQPIPDEVFDLEPGIEPYAAKEGAPAAIIVDIDGTLALHNGRSPYDLSLCGDDLPNHAVIEAVRAAYNAGMRIVFCSGREDYARDATRAWLLKHIDRGFVLDSLLLMRAADDKRKDSIVKRELFDTHVRDHFDVRYVLDDRQQVVDMWRGLGLTVFQVAEGDF